jgi:hypothetical protein
MSDSASSHPQLLYGDHLPTTEELRLSRTVIDEIDYDIEALEYQIEEIQAKISGLRRKRASYARQVSPLRKLPTEILREIVRLCIVTEDVTMIAGICSHLRDVALGMTEIWSNIALQKFNRTQKYEGLGKRLQGHYGSSLDVCLYFIFSLLHSLKS